ncbi:Chaperone protein [Dirofilaria immitis]
MLIHLTYSNDMDEENKCLDQFGPVYWNFLEQLNEIQQPMRMPLMQQLNQKRSLNKARNKLFKSSRFWGKRKDDTFNNNNPASTFDNTNSDESERRSASRCHSGWEFDMT